MSERQARRDRTLLRPSTWYPSKTITPDFDEVRELVMGGEKCKGDSLQRLAVPKLGRNGVARVQQLLIEPIEHVRV